MQLEPIFAEDVITPYLIEDVDLEILFVEDNWDGISDLETISVYDDDDDYQQIEQSEVSNETESSNNPCRYVLYILFFSKTINTIFNICY